MPFSPSLPIKMNYVPLSEEEKQQKEQPEKIEPKDYYKKIKLQKDKEKIVRKISDVHKDKNTFADFHFYINQYNKILEACPIEHSCSEAETIVIKSNAPETIHSSLVQKRLIDDLKRQYKIDGKAVEEINEKVIDPLTYYKKILIFTLPPVGYEIAYSDYDFEKTENNEPNYHYLIDSNAVLTEKRKINKPTEINETIVIKVELKGLFSGDSIGYEDEKYEIVNTLKSKLKELKKVYKIKNDQITYQMFILSPQKTNKGLSELAKEYGKDIQDYAKKHFTKSVDFVDSYDEVDELSVSEEYYDIIERENLADYFDVSCDSGNGLGGVVTYNFKERRVDLYFDKKQFGEIAYKAHEFKHLIQFERGEMDLGEDNKIGILNNIFIEREGNERAELFGGKTYSKEQGEKSRKIYSNNEFNSLYHLFLCYYNEIKKKQISFVIRYNKQTYVIWCQKNL